MSEIEIKHPKSYTELMNSVPEADRKCIEIINKQSAEALEESLFLAQLQQSQSTYLVIFDNGYIYGNISALELYNFLKLKIEYYKIYKAREDYAQSLYSNESAIYPDKERLTEKYKMFCNSLEPRLEAILKAAQLFIMPFNREIEKIIDETTNQVVKI